MSIEGLAMRRNPDAARLWPLRRVFQQHDDGCGIACLAMLAGLSYQQACLAIFDDGQGDATSLDDLRWALMAHGFRVPKRMTPFWEGWYTRLDQHALLAVNPAPDGMWHWAVWDADSRRILDPLRWPARKPVIVGYLPVARNRRSRRTTAVGARSDSAPLVLIDET